MVYEIQTIIRLMIETWMIVLWMIVSYPLGGQVGEILHGQDAPRSFILTGQLGDTQWVVS